MGAGGGRPVDGAALEQLVAAAAAQSAGLIGEGVAESAVLQSLAGPGIADRTVDTMSPGGGGPVDGTALEQLVAAAAAQSADLAGEGVAESAVLRSVAGPGVADGAEDAVGSGGRGPVDGAALELLGSSRRCRSSRRWWGSAVRRPALRPTCRAPRSARSRRGSRWPPSSDQTGTVLRTSARPRRAARPWSPTG